MISASVRLPLAAILCSLAFSALCFAQAPATDQQTAPPEQAPASAQLPPPETAPDIGMLMAYMKPDTVILQVGAMTLTWQELKPLTLPFTQSKPGEATPDPAPALRELLQRLALRGLYLHEVNAQNIQVSAEQRKANDELLEQGLRANPQGVSADDVKKAFAKDKSTLLVLTEEDAQRVVTFGNQFLDEITVSDEEIKLLMEATKAVRESLAKQNETTRTLILDLLKDPESQTDAGFARLAREHSEGIEAKDGGLMDYAFLPSDLARVNHLECFDLKPGQTSGLLETPTAFRVIRVLAVVQPQKPGEPERLRAAQWLFRKFPEDEESSREEIRARVTLAKQQQAVADIGKALQHKYPVSCIFFPEGLWPDAPGN